jgi:hypothetical protein
MQVLGWPTDKIAWGQSKANWTTRIQENPDMMALEHQEAQPDLVSPARYLHLVRKDPEPTLLLLLDVFCSFPQLLASSSANAHVASRSPKLEAALLPSPLYRTLESSPPQRL